MNIAKMNEALRFLIDKYAVPAGEIAESADGPVLRRDGEETPLLPWRVERRFVELKNLAGDGSLAGLSTLRFAASSDGGDLGEMAAREIDLAVWLTGSPVVSLFSVCSGRHAANIIAKLANDMNVSVELSTLLPEGAGPIDRHEIIARRGVASDRVVDSQVPQSSIYVFTAEGEKRYTDVDAELFGMPADEIWTVRAAFAVLGKKALAPEWKSARALMKRYAGAVVESDRDRRVVTF